MLKSFDSCLKEEEKAHQQVKFMEQNITDLRELAIFPTERQINYT